MKHISHSLYDRFYIFFIVQPICRDNIFYISIPFRLLLRVFAASSLASHILKWIVCVMLHMYVLLPLQRHVFASKNTCRQLWLTDLLPVPREEQRHCAVTISQKTIENWKLVFHVMGKKKMKYNYTYCRLQMITLCLRKEEMLSHDSGEIQCYT